MGLYGEKNKGYENRVTVTEKDSAGQLSLLSTQPSLTDPPNGGLEAWIQVLGGFFAVFNCVGVFTAFGAYESYYKNDLLSSNSQSTISWIGSIQGFLVISFSIVPGRLLDAGYLKHLLVVGSFMMSCGMMMASLGDKFYQIFLAQGVCLGIGGSCMFVTSMGTVSSYFTTRRALALGIAMTGSSIGGIIYPVMVHKLIPQVGFPWATRIIGFSMLATSGIPCICLKSRVKSTKRNPLLHYKSLTDKAFTTFTIGCFFGFCGIFVPIFYAQSFASDIQIDSNLVFYVSSILNAGSIVGRLLPNYLADKLGPINVLIPCALAASILIFAMVAIHNAGGLITFVIMYGLFSGSYVSLPSACVSAITSDVTVLGTRLGMNFFISGFGILVGSPIAGALIRINGGGYIYAQLFAGLCILIATVLTSIARLSITGPVISTKC